MGWTHFDGLQTIRVAHESRTGLAEVCQGPDGTRRVKLRVSSPACQREVLNLLDESTPVRLEDGVLELLLPWRDGISLRQWRYERSPTLGQRRDACLSLLEQQIEGNVPPCLTVLAANPENLVIENTRMFLQYLPNLKDWEPGMGEADAVCAVAAAIREVLALEPGRWFRGQLPEELQLLDRRQTERDYTSWGQLQRDVAAIPDELPRIRPVFRSRLSRVQGWLSRYGKYILRILAAVLLALALLSLASAYRRRQGEKGPAWEGMPQVGDQDLRGGEGGG